MATEPRNNRQLTVTYSESDAERILAADNAGLIHDLRRELAEKKSAVESGKEPDRNPTGPRATS